MVPTFTLDNLRDKRADEPRRWKAKIFHNLPNREADRDQLIRDVALYTCSAPTYFPVADGLSTAGCLQTIQAFAQSRRPWTGVGAIIRVLAIFDCFRSDQGQRIAYLPGDDHHWGVVQWGAKIIPILMEA